MPGVSRDQLSGNGIAHNHAVSAHSSIDPRPLYGTWTLAQQGTDGVCRGPLSASHCLSAEQNIGGRPAPFTHPCSHLPNRID